MTNKRSFGSLLHWATHRIPGVPAHAEWLAGHQGTAVHGRARRPAGVAAHPSLNHRWNHWPARLPRFMPAWQRRIAAFFSREL
ncbi:hypothetical protein ONA91_34650 [Micromonospora sp. DR5-3]|uniref:hypothetical protein n=1 Tax=unclassified Micromonospora TaxID=2617518 RepID=UPI0011D6FC1A|nr:MULTISPECIES: hypothetical protein [unclassified Micromonospora]MCW3819591.1 hypothetical protein [Micromonospora sp. DR5-3]TYC19959.1 hypothetical protein FXF52_33775 [Micromonospora sp. MP36]